MSALLDLDNTRTQYYLKLKHRPGGNFDHNNSMGKAKRTDLNSSISKNEIPGPGNYNVNSNIGKGPKVYKLLTV